MRHVLSVSLDKYACDRPNAVEVFRAELSRQMRYVSIVSFHMVERVGHIHAAQPGRLRVKTSRVISCDLV
jgi:hypothetical protein